MGTFSVYSMNVFFQLYFQNVQV